MSPKDDPFGSAGRTIFRPGLAGGRNPDGGEHNPLHDDNREAAAPDPTVFDPDIARRPPQGWSSGTVIELGGDVAAPTPRAPSEIAQDALLGAFAGIDYAAPNPILAAAAPLLMLFGDLRLIAVERQAEPLARHIAGAIREFDRKVAEAGVAQDDARIAKYVLCETADELVGTLPGIDRNAWIEDGMLARFFQIDAAGTGFFEALNTVLESPETHYDLLELMHSCLSLGFEGQYRLKPRAKDSLERVRRDVFETLRYFRERADPEISPRWQGLSATMAQKRARLPLWAIAAAVPALLAAAFFGMRISITDQGDALAEELLALNPREAVVIQRTAFVPPQVEAAPVEPPPPVVEVKPTAQIDRIRQALSADTTNGSVAVTTKGDFIVVEVDNTVLFDSGKAEVKAGFEAIAGHIAAALDPEPGPIKIVGHTDNVKPKRSSVFKSNYELSVARAEAVDKILKPKFSDPSRVSVEGKGDEEPAADNATPDGRARNRRVDVMIQKEETL